jgi:hypothetical protein
MDKLGKVIVTIVVIVICFTIFSVIVGVRSDNGASTPGILGLAVFAGAIAAIRAIWKKNDQNKNDGNDVDIDKYNK